MRLSVTNGSLPQSTSPSRHRRDSVIKPDPLAPPIARIMNAQDRKDRQSLENKKPNYLQNKKSNPLIPLQNKKPNRYIPRALKIKIWQKAKRKCQFVDKKTNTRCEANHALEFDHILPVSKGGFTTESNLSLLCDQHNRLKADNY